MIGNTEHVVADWGRRKRKSASRVNVEILAILLHERVLAAAYVGDIVCLSTAL